MEVWNQNSDTIAAFLTETVKLNVLGDGKLAKLLKTSILNLGIVYPGCYNLEFVKGVLSNTRGIGFLSKTL